MHIQFLPTLILMIIAFIGDIYNNILSNKSGFLYQVVFKITKHTMSCDNEIYVPKNSRSWKSIIIVYVIIRDACHFNNNYNQSH